MDIGILVTVIGVVLTALIGITALIYQRRQTKLAEEARETAVSKVHVDKLQQIRTKGRLRIGYIHYPPFAVAPMEDNDPPTGFYVDLIRRLCETEGITPLFEQLRFSSAIGAILNDSVDVVLPIFQTPRRSRTVNFTALLHSVSVSGVTLQSIRIPSDAELSSLPFKFVVCQGEIGHEILEDNIRVPHRQLTIIDTSNIADIIAMVAAKKADIAIADSLSCQHGLAARGAEGPKLKPILRRHPLYQCHNGVMIAKDQEPLAKWIDHSLKRLRNDPEFKVTDDAILEEFHPIVRKL